MIRINEFSIPFEQGMTLCSAIGTAMKDPDFALPFQGSNTICLLNNAHIPNRLLEKTLVNDGDEVTLLLEIVGG